MLYTFHIACEQCAIAKHYIFVPVEFVRDYVCIVYNTLYKVVLQSFTYLNLLSLCNIIHALHCAQDTMTEPLTQELHLSVAQLSALGSQASCSSLLMSLAR